MRHAVRVTFHGAAFQLWQRLQTPPGGDPVPYVPPAGNALTFNFTTAYTPVAGNTLAVNFGT